MLAGQKLMVGFDGTVFNSDLEFLISKLKISGLVLFSRNIESPIQLKKLVNDIHKFAEKSNIPKLFIGIDQEGGQVARLKKPFVTFEGNPSINNKQEAEIFAKKQAFQLLDMKINMNFAPVLDVIPENFDSIMEKRAFTGNPENVGKLGCHIIKTMQKLNVLAVAKHFPGIGRTIHDSHFELPVVDRNIDELASEELIPFQMSINSKVSGIMLSHILYPKLDSTWQASLSPKIARHLLREKLSFNGLILTDDLDMKSVKHDIKTSARQILKSSLDIVLICHKGPKIEEMFNEFKRLLNKNSTYLESAKSSLQRILKLKDSL